MSKKCAVIGDINVDILTPPFEKPEVLGESSIVLDEFQMSLGGNAINVAAELTALESECTFYGAMGDGPISNWIIQELKKLNVNSRLYTMDGHDAGITFAMNFVGGNRQFVATLGTNAMLKLEHINAKRVFLSDHLHRSGFWYTPGLLGSPNIYLMKNMISEGKQTSLDVGWDPTGFPKEHREILYDTLEYTEFFFANEKEISAITGKSRWEEGLNELLQITTHIDNPIVIVHQGPNGSIIASRSKKFKIPTKDVPQNNPTGTGDIYNAGFIYGLLNDWKLKKSAQFADKIACLHLSDVNNLYPKKNGFN